MNLLIKTKQAILRAQHMPSWSAIFYNPNFIVRRDLYVHIREYARLFSGRVMDFGCGRKPYRPLFENVRNEDYVGVDIEVSGHVHDNKLADVFYDGHTLPFADEYFDGVFSGEVFEHVPNLPEILAELRRTLKPGGFLLVTMPFACGEHEIPFDFRRFTSFGISRALQEAGFEIVEQRKGSGTVRTIAQLSTAYLVQRRTVQSSGALKLLVTALVIAPCNILGIVFSYLLPSDDSLFTCNVVLARRPAVTG